MLNLITKFLIIILVILLPLVNSHFFDLLFLDFWFYINWNYEFSKSIFFNIFSWLIIIFFFIQNLKKKLYFPKIIFLIIFIILISSFFSNFPLTAILWENSKWHWALLFINLILLFVVLINQKKEFILKIIKYTLLSSIFVILFWFKEYIFPTFDYWDLSNRAISTFGHPNYLSAYIILLTPLLFIKNLLNPILKYSIFIGLISILILTKSIFAIFLFSTYFLVLFLKNTKIKNKKNLFLVLFLLLFLIMFLIIYKFWLYNKLNSFVSRFYIWETTLRIIFSDYKILFIWNWPDTLSFIFDNYKSNLLYIYENIWFVADRPHNIILNIFYSFWFLWLVTFVYLVNKLIKNYSTKNKFIYHWIFLFFLFLLLNFSSISTYLILIILLAFLYKQKKTIWLSFLKIIFILFWIFSIYVSSFYYYNEYKLKNNYQGYYKNQFYESLIMENPEKKALYLKHSVEEACSELIKNIESTENYFYCGDLYRTFDKKKAKEYYIKGLEKIPDMWNKNSIYYESFLVKNLFSEHRFYSEKYSNLKEILQRVNYIK